MAPPSWAKGFVLGSGRCHHKFYDDFFKDDCTSKLMRAHLFYVCSLVGLVLCIHKAYYVFCKCKGFAVPPILSAPGLEIKIFLALFMGMIDVSSQVLFNGGTAPGWKLVRLPLSIASSSQKVFTFYGS
mmetsp:Transcript_54215/g.101268  ORF Transcript_54215/g.101268 Transcript_54215/m.101268 type:complete len:128 (+) Transcript_54215:527-910(+)